MSAGAIIQAALDALPKLVEGITFAVVLIQAVRHRAAHQSVLDAVAQAQDHAERAAAAAGIAAGQASQVLTLMQPHATALAAAVERLPVSRGKRVDSGAPAAPADASTAPTDPAPAPAAEPPAGGA